MVLSIETLKEEMLPVVLKKLRFEFWETSSFYALLVILFDKRSDATKVTGDFFRFFFNKYRTTDSGFDGRNLVGSFQEKLILLKLIPRK